MMVLRAMLRPPQSTWNGCKMKLGQVLVGKEFPGRNALQTISNQEKTGMGHKSFHTWFGAHRSTALLCSTNHMLPHATTYSSSYSSDLTSLVRNGEIRAYSTKGQKAPSQSINAPAGLTPKPSSLRVFMQSPNVIAEPYQKPLPFRIQTVFTGELFKQMYKKVIGMIRSMYCIAMLRKHVVGFNQTLFEQTAAEMYKTINELVSEQQHSRLRQLATESIFTQLKREMKQHELGGWASVKWTLEKVHKMDIVQARLIQPSMNDIENAFVQLTVEFTTTQKFAAFDVKGDIVAGDPTRTMNVVDYWVLERAVKQAGARWRLAARISV